MPSKRKNLARLGMLAKGAVYSLIGLLTAMAAFGQGGQTTGSKGALQYVASLSYGKIMLLILGIGLLGYTFWRMYQAFGNPKNLSDDFKGYAKRIAYFISGLVYGFLSVYAFKLGVGKSAGSGGSGFMGGSDLFAIIIGIGIAIKAIYDLYRAYSGKFREEVEEIEMSREEQKVLLNAGKFGHTARGLVLGLMAFLTLKSGFGSKGVSTQTDAFSYIQSEYGSFVLGVIAIGLVFYGVYMFIQAKYPSISVS